MVASHLMENVLGKKYRAVWETTLRNGQITEDNVSVSKSFFELSSDNKTPKIINGSPVPKRFNTYGLVCCLPFPEYFQKIIEGYWKHFLTLLSNPISYGVKPQNRHVEIFLFQSPKEIFTKEEIESGIAQSLSISKDLSKFKIFFHYPFITPDGTIVVPGFETTGSVEALRSKLREKLSAYPQKQSQWLHTSLGRILEPLDRARMELLLRDMESHRGEVIGEVSATKLLWTWEKQWYMTDKKVIKTLDLK